jgi:hypothetical protein
MIDETSRATIIRKTRSAAIAALGDTVKHILPEGPRPEDFSVFKTRDDDGDNTHLYATKSVVNSSAWRDNPDLAKTLEDNCIAHHLDATVVIHEREVITVERIINVTYKGPQK